MKTIIIGAGLAGPLLAQGLTLAGIDVTVYEREPAIDQRGQGYRIHIGPEGELALRSCLPPELYERAAATSGVRGRGVTFLDPRLNVVRRFDVDDAPEAEQGRHLVVDRLTLRRILLTGLDVRQGIPFECYELLGDGRVRAHLATGETADADLLVAADGTHSRIRAQLLPGAEVTETGQFLIYGRTPLTARVRELAPPAALEGFSAVAGTDGRFMPLAAFESRGGGEGYLMWVVGAPTALRPADVSGMDGEGLRKTAAGLVADWPPELAEIIRLGDPGTVHSTTVRTAKPVPRWETGPVTLMGDAIHSMVPTGNSAAVALRDAALLCRRVTERDGSLLDAVGAYEAEMLEYGFAAVEASLRGV
ncbi:MAG TPA: NAD(P)/FAD-dependent oxidoreductase [Actinophytocola sp.]|nr:NAD(P)/FAD-dependent oxidoreductase [Actinophytocola sp.]